MEKNWFDEIIPAIFQGYRLLSAEERRVVKMMIVNFDRAYPPSAEMPLMQRANNQKESAVSPQTDIKP